MSHHFGCLELPLHPAIKRDMITLKRVNRNDLILTCKSAEMRDNHIRENGIVASTLSGELVLC